MKSRFVHPILFLAVVISPASLLIAQPAGTFIATGDMTTPRGGLTATLLTDGTVLIVGGGASAELYDPRTATFKATGNKPTPHGGYTATLLPDGKVLIAGGVLPGSVLASAELYDPAKKTFTPTGDMTMARWGHAATYSSAGES